MLNGKTIKSKEYWRQQFGLYPMLMQPKAYDNKFLMLNGGDKDFCLLTDNIDYGRDVFFSESWSTNTKNFLVINNDKVYVYNWTNGETNNYPLNKIEENPNRFYSYLSSQSYKTLDDAVPYIINVFRQLRNYTKKKEPEEALNLLFKLLISIDKEENFKNINVSKWEILDVEVPDNFDYYVEQIRRGVKSISPNRDLILRHVSGALFQEAHKEVIYFDPQMDLFSGFSDKLIVNKNLYSSVHYTPHYLARSIVENCLNQLDLNKESLKIFDPACGSSEFLIETLKQLQNLNYQGKVKVIGWDTSPSAVCTSNFLLKYEQLTQWDKSKLKFEIKPVTDSLTEQWDNDYDLIIMNPPFVSWELMKNKENRDAVLAILGSSFERKRPNIAGAFFYKAVKSLNKGGMIGCILPYSIFTSDTYTKIRQEIKEEVNVSLVAKLGNYIFENALTDICFFIGTKINSIYFPKLIWCKNEKNVAREAFLDLRKMVLNNQQTIEKENYNVYSAPQFPMNIDDWRIISQGNSIFKQNLDKFVLTGKLNPITDIFTINQGLLSGAKNIFEIVKEDYITLPKEEKKFFRPVITNKSIRCGQLEIYEFIWFPYNKNGIMIKKETELKSISFAKEILIPNKKILTKREGINEWWGLTRPRRWQFEKGIRLYSNRFGNSESFAIDTKGNCVIEEGNAFIPIEEMDMDDYYFYLSVFSSDIFDILLSIYSKPIMYGYDLGKIQIKNIPIPNIHLQGIRELEQYSRLVELGKELEKGNQYLKQIISDIVKMYYPLCG